MAIFHLHAKQVSRGKGQNLASKSAYNSGGKIVCPRTARIYNHTFRQDVSYQEILLPHHANPDLGNRQTLVQAIEGTEKRCDARLALDIEMSLPVELKPDENLILIKKFVKQKFVDRGLIVDLCIHKLTQGNPHCHLLVAPREIGLDGEFARKKDRSRENKHWIIELRHAWAEAVNEALNQAGHQQRVSHRSHEDRQIELLPTIHVGPNSANSSKNKVALQRKEHNERIGILNGMMKERHELVRARNLPPIQAGHISTPTQPVIDWTKPSTPVDKIHIVNPNNTANPIALSSEGICIVVESEMKQSSQDPQAATYALESQMADQNLVDDSQLEDEDQTTNSPRM